ncbi:Uncharacterized protein SCG7109_AN_00200 [Chlamydiales bacterium SCGC AG-110-M15]|nr:Uncharacterized protein SCG7109_AN_00200 [Chlamydiales bacterium SCGC AG-110-M15]
MTEETVSLREIAYARSGDKGSNANVGVIAYTSEGFAFLESELTADCVAKFFAPLEVESVERFELPNLSALNFVLKGVLAGGGSSSLRVDSQGKTLGQALLEMPIKIDNHKLSLCRLK